MDIPKRFFSWAAIALFAASLTQSALAVVGTVYLKNNGQYAAHVWIDGKYQGRVPAGDTRYAVRDGFVTSDGGSVGGWQANGDVQVVTASTDDKGNNWYAEVNLPADAADDGRVWFGGPLALNDSDKENAAKIIISGNGNGPTGMLQNAQKAAQDKRDDKGSPPPASSDTSKKTEIAKVSWSPMPIQIGDADVPEGFVGKWVDNRGGWSLSIDKSGVMEWWGANDNREITAYAYKGKPVKKSGAKISWICRKNAPQNFSQPYPNLQAARAAAVTIEGDTRAYYLQNGTLIEEVWQEGGWDGVGYNGAWDRTTFHHVNN